ncbi:MAG TPA: hypothetical protein VFO62_10690 [Candidatus Binatia bacterium]|nr:hypothetical protein [Candidatus Binatia bacterium]
MSDDDDHDNFAVGDAVTWIEWSPRRTVRGRVERVTPNRVTARPDGGGKARTFYRRTDLGFECCRVDVAREKWHRDLEAWWEARPRIEWLSLSPIMDHEEVMVSTAGQASHRASLALMMQITDEAHAIREWLRKRPEEPRS